MTFLKVAGLIGLPCAILALVQTQTGSPAQTLPALRVDVDQVLLHVTVTDRNNRYVNGLSSENFRVWEDKIEQHIEYFSNEDLPLSIGIIFDISGSMENKMRAAQIAANAFLRMGNRDDEYFLVEFNDSPKLVQDFTTDIAKLQSRLLMARGKGTTSMYDALYVGLENVRHGTNARKALLLITDGEDNHSRYSFGDLKEFAKEHDVTIYGIGIEDELDWQFASFSGRARIESLADLTGGEAFFPRSADDLLDICLQIGLNLKNQYVIGYRPQNLAADGKWRKIQIKVVGPEGPSAVHVRAKAGYYASRVARAMK